MADVFLSYASEDRASVQKLVTELESVGYSVWWDRGLEAGETFDTRIERELNDATSVVVVWTSNSVISRWVLSEAMAAFERDALIPITLSDELAIPLPFNRLHTISFSDTQFVKHILAGIERIKRGEGSVTRSAQIVRLDDKSARLPALAVLRFESYDYESQALQISDQLILALSKFTGIRLISRRASLKAEYQTEDLAIVANQLQADWILTGVVNAHGDADFSVNIEICRGSDGEALYANGYQYEKASAKEIGDSIARSLSGPLLKLVAESDTSSTDVIVAKARRMALTGSPDALNEAESLAQGALDLDPRAAAPKVLLAALLIDKEFASVSANYSESTAQARALINEILPHISENARELKYAGYVLACCGDHAAAEQILRQAIAANPYDEGTRGFLGWVLSCSSEQHHREEIQPILDDLIDKNPTHPGRSFWVYHRSVSLTCAADHEAALASAQEAVALNPQNAMGWLTTLNALGVLGRHDEAQKLLDRANLSIFLNKAEEVLAVCSRDSLAAERRTAGLRDLELIG